jgi:hypothetical protein
MSGDPELADGCSSVELFAASARRPTHRIVGATDTASRWV